MKVRVHMADVDGYTSSAILWNYVKDFYPNANLHFLCHEHKNHGFDDTWEQIDEEHWDLILLPDSSSNDYLHHKHFKEQGTDILILD